MKIQIWTYARVVMTDFLPEEFHQDFGEHLNQMARENEGCGHMLAVKHLSDLIRVLSGNKADDRYVSALRKLLGVCRDNCVNEVILE